MEQDGGAAPRSTKAKKEGDLSEYKLDDYDEDEEQEMGALYFHSSATFVS